MDHGQEDMLSLSGVFLVAGELLRRNMAVAITFGNPKKCDVIIRGERTIISIEIKTTRDANWIIGKGPPEPNGLIWVLVHLPRENLPCVAPSEFFVLTGAELHAILKPAHDAALKKIPRIPRMCSVSCDEVENYNSAWETVRKALGQPS